MARAGAAAPGADGRWVIVGRVSGLHGVRGWVKVYSHTRPPEAIFDYQPWHLGPEHRAVQAVDGRRQGKVLLAKLEGFDDRDAAARLVDLDIAVAREALPAPAEGEYYWADLEGLEVRNLDGIVLGRVDHLIETGAHDVLVLEAERQRLVPFVQGRYVKNVSLVDGVITVDWDPED